MLACLLERVRPLARTAIRALARRVAHWTRPATSPSLVLGTVADLVRSRPELVAENALLRQQLIVLARTPKRPRLIRADRPLLVLLASRVPAWRQALRIVQPATLLRWRREGFRLLWRRRSDSRRRPPRVAPETIALIRRMARENRLWGAERVQGGLLKLGIRLSKRTDPEAPPSGPPDAPVRAVLGRPSCATTPRTFGRATSSNSPTRSFVPSSPSSSSSSAPVAWCTSASRAHRPAPGPRSSCARRRRRGPDRASSSTTTTPSTAPSSTASPPPAASR
jgi:hypothetical protein